MNPRHKSLIVNTHLVNEIKIRVSNLSGIIWDFGVIYISQTRGSVRAEIVERWISKMWKGRQADK